VDQHVVGQAESQTRVDPVGKDCAEIVCAGV